MKCIGISRGECWYQPECREFEHAEKSDACAGGEGGPWVIDIYAVSIESVDCTVEMLGILWENHGDMMPCFMPRGPPFKGTLDIHKKCDSDCKKSFGFIRHIWPICQNAETISGLEKERFDVIMTNGLECKF